MTDPHIDQVSLEAEQMETRIEELEHEQKLLLATVEILQDISGTLHFVDILQMIARRLGDTFGLDRCSIFLIEQGTTKARLVASYEDPSIRNYVVDLDRYPELRRALETGETVYVPDAQNDPALKHIKGVLEDRSVQSITVVPIVWRGSAIGAIFLRTFRDGTAFSDKDVRFTKVIAGLAAKMLRNAYRYEQLVKRQSTTSEETRRTDFERIALVGFLRRFLEAYTQHEGAWGEGLLSRTSGEELDRLVEVAMTVVQEEARSL
jgi:two-component system cell cycle response regulator